VLLIGPARPVILKGLSDFTVHSLPVATDRDAFFAAITQLRAIAVSAPVERVDDALFARLPELEIIASFGVGYDHIDANAAAQRGIVVTHTPDVLTEEVADTAIGLLLCTVRELPQAERHVRAGKWLKSNYPLTRATLRNRTVGMVGMGRIGMARAVDTLIVIVPGGPATTNMIDAKVLEALGADGILINIARGSVVDEEALIAALKERTIMAAGLDVFVNEPDVPAELLALENVVLFPHVGSASAFTREKMDQLMVDNILAWAAGKAPLTPVPETPRRSWS
jgi:hypothetical protein